eukprot:6207378-Prymnesium_polylepis.1
MRAREPVSCTRAPLRRFPGGAPPDRARYARQRQIPQGGRGHHALLARCRSPLHVSDRPLPRRPTTAC